MTRDLVTVFKTVCPADRRFGAEIPMQMKNIAKLTLFAGVTLSMPVLRLAAAGPDPNGILRKPIPDKLVVLTFDDGCASHATVVAPILKSLGFGGSFYVCDFDSFHTRKDWYLTWRQMQAMAADGFEIGNHTVGHAGGASIGPFQAMEDQLLAHHVPKPTSIAWPVFQVNTNTYPELAANGYIFGRGGHFRPYRPTVDNPFDIPCLGAGTIGEFVKSVRQAASGRIVVICFHGVPDGEHPAVGIEPAVFKVMMQYLKDNNYKVIALRDLAEYIDPVKAAKLPPTANEFKEDGAATLAGEDKPHLVMDMTKPTADSAADQVPPSPAKDMLTFVLPGSSSVAMAGTRIDVCVPPATDVTALAPAFTLSPLAAADPASGTTRNFTTPQTYAITAQDGSSQACTVTVVKSGEPSAFAWKGAAAGDWSDGSKWSDNLSKGAAPAASGRPDYVLTFHPGGGCTTTCDFSGGFQLNQLNFGGSGVKVDGKELTFVANGVTGTPPRINQTGRGGATISAPLRLASDLTVDAVQHGEVALKGPITGPGRLIKDGDGRLKMDAVPNSYGGGTVIKRGSLLLMVANEALGSGPLTLNHDAVLALEHVDGTNPLILNGGTIHAGNGFGDSWNAPIILNGNTRITSYATFHLNNKSGGMSGPGGFTQIGGLGAFGPSNSGWVTLNGVNTYTGPTTVWLGTLLVKKAASLYNADAAQWTPDKITVFNTATLVLSVGGPGEFTGAQIDTLLGKLTTRVNNNGLMGGAVLVLDTANATDTVTIAADIADSKGPGGGPFSIRKGGAGTLQLTGDNTFSGRIGFDGGCLVVSTLNRIAGGRASSSLGAPSTLEDGIIDLGGDCTLTYTGRGEVTDRVMDLTGKGQTVTLDHSGTGLLKFTSPFDISGYGHSKTVVLKGSTAGAGELAGDIADPYDRAGKASTSVTKSGTGIWTLSGNNSFTGPTTVTQGTLALTNLRGLGATAEVSLADGALLDLGFKGEIKVRKLTLGGAVQSAGRYGAANAPGFIKGTGVITLIPLMIDLLSEEPVS